MSTLVEQDAEKRAQSLLNEAAEIAKLESDLAAKRRMYARRVEHHQSLMDDDDEQAAARAFENLQRRYRSKVRKDLTGVRELRPMKDQPSIYRAWDSLFDDWLYKNKPLAGIHVDYERLTSKTGVQERQLRNLMGKLLHVHLLPVAGGKGRGHTLKVVPASYPFRLDENGEPEFTETLVTFAPAPKAKDEDAEFYAQWDGLGNG
jgi:hypothetical protein